jgi:hypothetical protein
MAPGSAARPAEGSPTIRPAFAWLAPVAALLAATAVSADAAGRRPAAQPTPTITARIRLQRPVAAIEFGFGALWGVEIERDLGHRRASVVRIDPTRRRVVARITGAMASPGRRAHCCLIGNGLAVGAGSVWSDGEGGGSFRHPALLFRIDPTTSRIASRARLEAVRGVPSADLNPGQLLVERGSVWVRNYGGGGKVRRYDPVSGQSLTYDAGSVARASPRTGRQLVAIRTRGVCPAGMAYGARALWVLHECDRTVVKIDPRRNRVVKTIRLRDRTPVGIAFAGGSVWVTSGANSRVRTVSRIAAPSGRLVKTFRFRQPVRYEPSDNRSPRAVGEELWVPSGMSGRTVARIDTRTNRLIGHLVVGRGPDSVTIDDDGSIWVSTIRDAAVVRVDLRS